MIDFTSLVQTADAYEQELPAFPEGGRTDLPINRLIDHTLLKPEATPEQIEVLCREALEHHFASAVANSIFAPQMARLLKGSDVAVCCVVGFPLGAMAPQMKAAETRYCLEQGAREIDTVIPVGFLKSGQYAFVEEDIRGVVAAAHSAGALVKVIIETSLLTRREKILACLLSQAAGADFVKTSTGFSSGGATPEDIELMRRVVGPVAQMGVKASGGVRSLDDARKMIIAGANRLGTSSGVKIMLDLHNQGQSA